MYSTISKSPRFAAQCARVWPCCEVANQESWRKTNEYGCHDTSWSKHYIHAAATAATTTTTFKSKRRRRTASRCETRFSPSSLSFTSFSTFSKRKKKEKWEESKGEKEHRYQRCLLLSETRISQPTIYPSSPLELRAEPHRCSLRFPPVQRLKWRQNQNRMFESKI